MTGYYAQNPGGRRDRMNWDSLMVERCPKCGSKLIEDPNIWRCASTLAIRHCTFMIGKEKYRDMVKKMYDRERGDIE